MIYVVGFMFSPGFDSVVLIRKNRPEWQKGKLNGVGGKVKVMEGEDTHTAMVREFKEEVGVATRETDWSHFLQSHGVNDDLTNFTLHVFATTAWDDHVRSVTDEQVVVSSVLNVAHRNMRIVESCRWMIPMAIDHLRCHNLFGKVFYPPPRG